jgi:hypothetical protein
MNYGVIKKCSIVLFWSGVCVAQAHDARPLAEPLTLDAYLHQVMRSHEGYLGAQAQSAGALEVSKEAALLFAPQLVSHVEYAYNWWHPIQPEIFGDHAVTKTVTLGVQKLTEFGLQTRLSLAVTQTTLYGADPALTPNNAEILVGPYFEFTQSLWQNGLGRSDRKKAQALDAQDKATFYSNSYQAKAILAEAETLYWKLAIMRETARVQQESESRTVALRDFNADRVRRHLADVSDLLTSDAALESKKLDLQSALDDERNAARAFNAAREIDSDELEERLSVPDPDFIQSLTVPTRAAMRDDTRAAAEIEVATTANSEVSRDQQTPTLNLFGSDTSVGINLAVPLDMGTTASIRSGYAKEIKAAELTYQRKYFEQESDWKNLERKFREAKVRLAIAVRMQHAQQLKFEHERTRQKLGLTTAYQLFQYELDYLNSEMAKIQLEGLILGLEAQMKTYRGDS